MSKRAPRRPPPRRSHPAQDSSTNPTPSQPGDLFEHYGIELDAQPPAPTAVVAGHPCPGCGWLLRADWESPCPLCAREPRSTAES